MKKTMTAIAALAVTMSLATVQAAQEPVPRQAAKEAEAKPALQGPAAKTAAPLKERAHRSEIKARGAEARKRLLEENNAPQVPGRQ